MNNDMSKNDTIQSIDRALLVLETISEKKTISLADLCKTLKINKPSLLRIVHTLVANGYLQKNEIGHYSLTLKNYEIGINAVKNIDQMAVINTVLLDLSKETGLVAQFSVEDNFSIICLQSISQNRPSISTYTNVGKRSPFYCTSAGKAILSVYSNIQITEMWQHFHVAQFTEHTIMDVQSLLHDISETRRRRYALDLEENELNVFCTGALVVNSTGASLGAISISGTNLSREKIEYFSPMVVKSAERLSALLGYSNPISR